jgi:hypothetical protein
MALRPALQDEYTTQSLQCKALDVDLNNEDDTPDTSVAWGADPFCILAQLEEELGYPLALS